MITRRKTGKDSGESNAADFKKTDAGFKLSKKGIGFLRAAGVRGPLETGLKDFIEGTDWRGELQRLKGCGPATVKQIGQAAREAGIDTEIGSMDKGFRELFRKHGLTTSLQIRDFIEDNPDWRNELGLGLYESMEAGKALRTIGVFSLSLFPSPELSGILFSPAEEDFIRGLGLTTAGKLRRFIEGNDAWSEEIMAKGCSRETVVAISIAATIHNIKVKDAPPEK